MNTVAFLSHLRSLGIRLWLDGDRLRVKAGPGVITPVIKKDLAARKEKLIEFLRDANTRGNPVVALLSQLRKTGIKLTLEGEKLRVKASAGALTPQLKRQMAEQKPAIIAFLRQAQGASPNEPADDYIDPVQRRQWVLQQLVPNPHVHHLPLALDCHGHLQSDRLRTALTGLIQRHPSLRMAFPVKHGKPTLLQHPSAEPRFRIVDLEALTEEERTLLREEQLAEEITKPMDLAQAPLLRVTLFHLDADHHTILFILHRIIADHWSLQALTDDFLALYEQNCSEEDNHRLALRYQKVADARRALFKSDAYKQQLNWWASRLNGWPLVLELPCDHPRSKILSFQGKRHPLTLSPELVYQLEEYTRGRQELEKKVLLSAFAGLIYRYSRKDHFLIATPTPGYRQEKTGNLIGRFANMLALRADFVGEPNFSNVVESFAREIEEIDGRVDVLPSQLAEELQQDPDMCYNPICQIKFVYKTVASNCNEMAGIKLKVRPILLESALYDLTLRVEKNAHRHLELEFNPEFFELQTIERMAHHYLRLLSACLKDPHRPVGELNILGDDERNQLLYEWNRTQADYPRDTTLHKLFEQQVDRTPDNPAICTHGDDTLTYRELNEKANQLAHYLKEQGIGEEKFVGIFTTPGAVTVIAVLAVLKAGGAYVPLHPSLPKPRLTFMLEDTSASVILTQGKFFSDLPTENRDRLCLDTEWARINTYPTTNMIPPKRATHSAYVIYTPISTGKPKAVVASHRAVVNRMSWLLETFPLTTADRVLQRTPLTSGTAANEVFWPLISGAQLVVPNETRRYNYPALVGLIAAEQITTLHLVPYGLEKLLVETLISECISLKRVFCGAEALGRDLTRDFYKKLPQAELVNLYGSTEAGGEITSWVCSPQSPYPVAPIGRPIGNTRVYLLDDRMQPVPIGVPGLLYVAGTGLAGGYLNRHSLTHERFLPDPFSGIEGEHIFKTGDQARYLPDGNIEFLGRADGQVKVRGMRVDLDEIEAALNKHEAVRECAALFKKDAFGEPKLVAYYASDQSTSLPNAVFVSFLEDTLPREIIPTTFVRTEKLPIDATGQVDRSRLPTPEEFQRLRDAFPRAYSEVERAIARVWRRVLGIEKAGVDDNFFDLGGDSLQMLEVYHALPDILKRDLVPTDLFQYPTIHQLGLYLENEEDEADFAARREDMQERVVKLLDQWEQAPGLNLAVIGWAGLFPGAKNPAELWQNLLDGVESITFFSKEELAEAGVDEDILDDPYYVRARAICGDIREFDAAFFNMTSREAVLSDPQQRTFMECTYQALEHAGYASANGDRSIGLFGGCGESLYYTNHLRENPRVSESVDGFAIQIGNGKDYLCTRTSHLLGLRGMAVSVQAGAATSMMAIAGAVNAILAGECHLAIAGGVYLGPTKIRGYMRRTDRSLSEDGHCRPFDKAAQGQVPGQGCALVVLKKLTDAIRDGDAVHAIIRGLSMANNGGRGQFGAPCRETWAETITQAHRSAGVPAESITFIETDGSGNPEQDAIEILALADAYKETNAKPGSVALGGIKANIGSLDHAGSATALIKACLTVRGGVLPANIHFKKAPENFQLDQTPFYINESLIQWETRDFPRRAGVNIFDTGGHHGHVIVEEPPILPPAPRQRPWHLLTLSAKDANALETMTAGLAAHLKARPHLDFSDVCFTLSSGRDAMRHRRMVVAQNLHEAILELEQHNPERVFTRATPNRERPVAFMFPGQGVQYQNMGRQLYQVEPAYREVVDRCWAIVGLNVPDLYENLASHNRGSRSERLHQTYVTQPATFITEYALANLLIKWGIEPTCMIGNSLGEYVAATLAGVFSLEDALSLVCTRGRLMQSLPEGRQLAVALSENEIAGYLNDELSLAGMAGPQQAMVAGSKAAINALKKELDERQIICFRLFTSHAFHSYMMDPIMKPFEEAVAEVQLKPPARPFISTITGSWITDEQATSPAYWAQQFRQPVRFSKGLEVVFGKWNNLIALEVGPDKQLTTMAIRHPAKTKKHLVLATMRQPMEEESDCHHLLNTLGRLWLNGFPITWEGFHDERRNRRLALPTYPFQRKIHWLSRPGDWDLAEESTSDERESPTPSDIEEEDYREVPTDLVAPRDPLETEIAGYWQQTLGLSELGIYDDFFELGGNSLIGVRLVNLLRRKLRVPLANPILLQKRSVAALSDYIKEIRALGSGEGDQNSIIVQLQRGERGNTPLFLFHPIEGDILIYRQLVDYLGSKQPVFAVQARSLVGGDAFTDIPTQAAAYLEDIRKIQSRGPYLMAGFSYGGFLAYEISRLLMSEGEKVSFTAMIDSSHPSTIHMDMKNPVEILKFLTGYVIDFPEEEYLGLSDEEQIAYAESRIRAANRASLIPPVFGLEMCRTWLGHQKALASYHPKAFPGRVMFFNATELMGDASGGGYYPWLDLVQGGLELHHVPGHHISIMNVPDQVKVISKQIKRAIRQS